MADGGVQRVREVEAKAPATAAQEETEQELVALASVYCDLKCLISQTSSDGEKLTAASRLLDGFFQRPIARQRWDWVFPRLVEEAHHRNVSPEELLRLKALTALFVAAEIVTERVVMADSLKAVRAALNDLLTEDILGPNWRRHAKEENLEAAAGLSETSDELGDVESRLTLQGAALAAGLCETDTALLLSVYSGLEIKTAASRLGLTETAAHTRLHRARKIIRKYFVPQIKK